MPAALLTPVCRPVAVGLSSAGGWSPLTVNQANEARLAALADLVFEEYQLGVSEMTGSNSSCPGDAEVTILVACSQVPQGMGIQAAAKKHGTASWLSQTQT